jgi:hypothetical protein
MLSQKHKNLIANQFRRSKVIDYVWGNFSQGAGTPGTQRNIAFSQLAVRGLIQFDSIPFGHCSLFFCVSSPKLI